MKKILFLSLLLAFSLSSCCTKKQCVNAFDLNEIELRGFDMSDLDSVRVISYQMGSNFSVETARGLVSFDDLSANSNGYRIHSPIALLPTQDFRVEVLGANLVYSFSGIETEEQKCNSCFGKTDKYLQMRKFQLNGQEVEAAYFGIDK